MKQNSTKLNKTQQNSTKLNKSIKFCLFVFLALILSNCQVEEDAIKKENNIQTVSLNEAISFLKENPVNQNSNSAKKTTLLPDLDKITQEKIINSDQLLTVIPLSTTNENQNSRILLLKIDNKIQSVNFRMYRDENSSKGSFSGKILIYNLNDDFINGYRIKEGYIISQLIKKINKNETSNNKSIVKKNTQNIVIDGVDFTESNVIIVYNRYHSINLGHFFALYDQAPSDFGGGGGGYGESWDYGGSGENTILSNSPSFKFDPADNYNIIYPKFTTIVSNIADYVNSNQKIMQTLQKYTGLNNVQILEKLKFGQGPTVKINQLGNNYGYHNPLTNTVQIDIDYVNKLENSLGAKGEILNLMLSITLLHEFVHWTDGLFFNYTQENGNNWEIATYGFVVNMGNITLVKP